MRQALPGWGRRCKAPAVVFRWIHRLLRFVRDCADAPDYHVATSRVRSDLSRDAPQVPRAGLHIARRTTRHAKRAGIGASGEPMVHSVSELITHQITGMASSSQRARPLAVSRMPSVAMDVGSGAMPNTSACVHGRPSNGPISG